MVFQDPAASLNERATVDYIVSEGLYNFHLFENEEDRVRKVENIISEVGLLPEHLTRYPQDVYKRQLYNKIVGDAFAPRNPYCLEIDTLREPPMFQVSETHFAKTWLLDPRAPKVEKPETIQNIHEKLVEAFNI